MQLTPERTASLLARIDSNLTGSRAHQVAALLVGDNDRADDWAQEVDRLLELRQAVAAGLVAVSDG